MEALKKGPKELAGRVCEGNLPPELRRLSSTTDQLLGGEHEKQKHKPTDTYEDKLNKEMQDDPAHQELMEQLEQEKNGMTCNMTGKHEKPEGNFTECVPVKVRMVKCQVIPALTDQVVLGLAKLPADGHVIFNGSKDLHREPRGDAGLMAGIIFPNAITIMSQHEATTHKDNIGKVRYAHFRAFNTTPHDNAASE